MRKQAVAVLTWAVLFFGILAWAVGAGAICCVCDDGSCLETEVMRLPSCAAYCKAGRSKGISYNKDGTCSSGGCAEAVRRIQGETRSDRKGEEGK